MRRSGLRGLVAPACRTPAHFLGVGLGGQDIYQFLDLGGQGRVRAGELDDGLVAARVGSGVRDDHEEVAEIHSDRIRRPELAGEASQAAALGSAGLEIVAQDGDREIRLLRPEAAALGLQVGLELVEGSH